EHKWKEEDMKQAIEAVRNHTMGYLKASKHYKVPWATLYRYCKSDKNLDDIKKDTLGRQPILPPELEDKLVNHIVKMEKQFFGLTRRDRRSVTFQLARQNNIPNKFSLLQESAGKNGQKVFLFDVGELFGQAYVKVQSAERAIKGFATTGLYATRRSIFSDEDFLETAHQDENRKVGTRSTKPGKAKIITSTPNKEEIKKSVRIIKKKKILLADSKAKKKKLTERQKKDLPSSSSESASSFSVHNSSDDDVFPGKGNLDRNAYCIFCDIKFSENTHGEMWVMCIMCSSSTSYS
ncbi:hypothetical protein ILUMI_15543, partial [Ignelater luminosus]